jgi:demethylmacrocin O-methyltransferase
MNVFRELQLMLLMKKYNTDKIRNGLLDVYKNVFGNIRNKKISLLEIGVAKGGSVKFWADYFKHPESTIIGLDIALPNIFFPKKVIVYQCDQNNSEHLKEIAIKHGPFDIIIDDGSHLQKETMNCFNVLLDYVVAGGYYVIEDWAVGYSDKPKYKGMVNVITNIIENASRLKIEAFNVLLDYHKALAFFKKGTTGWKE